MSVPLWCQLQAGMFFLQGSAVKHLGVVIFDDQCIADLLLGLPVKELKSVSI